MGDVRQAKRQKLQRGNLYSGLMGTGLRCDSQHAGLCFQKSYES